MIMLQKRLRARLARHDNWLGSEVRPSNSSSKRVDSFEESIAEKPIEIRMGAEEVVTTTPRGKNKKVVKQPPPVYGSFRQSQVH